MKLFLSLLLFSFTFSPFFLSSIARGGERNSFPLGFLELVTSIGKSVNGVPLWVIEISDKPGEEEPEPAFKFIGNVHGDEPVGREVLVLLANWICNNYNKYPLARLIVKNVHLHILPPMNPDGFSLRTRNNVNNIDLNRDFPDQGLIERT